MQYFLGIDGGGTKTKCVLIDQDGSVLFEAESDASNPLSVGIAKSTLVLSNLIKKVYFSFNKKKINSIAIGLAGAGRINQADEIKREVLELLSIDKILFDYLVVVSDAEAALEGAFAGEPGAILISGTGSIIFGKDKSGKVFRTGGYGKIIGDEGSGYSIATRGLNAVAKEYDGSDSKTILTKMLYEKHHISSKEDLINKVYSENFDVASIAKLVIKCADAGDKICCKILKEEIEKFIAQIELLIRKMKVEELSLALSGGLVATDNYFSKEFEKKILSKLKEVEIKRIKYTAEVGAALIAKKISMHN